MMYFITRKSITNLFNSSRVFVMAAIMLIGNAAHTATIQVINKNAPGVGFNDTTPASPIGGNTGTTLGQQRMIAFQYAANIWGNLLQSTPTIRVGAQFTALSCSTYSATLGSAGPDTAFRDFIGAPVASTWYPAALASALAGVDLYPSGNHIEANFNSNIGTAGCLEGSGWYFGLDRSPSPGKIDFVSVLLHELAHGLGFVSFVNLSTGAKALGYDDAYMRNLEQHGAVPSGYPAMSDSQRLAASTSTGNLHWTGANVRAAVSSLSAGQVGDHVKMYAPNPAQAGSSVSHWDTTLTPNQIMEPSYTEPLHSPVLELPLFRDLGWAVSSSPTNYALSVTVTGQGTITSSPAGISACASSCSANFSSGSVVTLTATSAANYIFNGWSGACSGTGQCTVAMSSAKSVVATFTMTPQFRVSIAKAGTGGGSVTRNGGALNCGSTCTESLPQGSTVILQAIPQNGSVFSGWTGSTCTGTGTCAFSLGADKTVTAIFDASTGGINFNPILLTDLSGTISISGTKNYFITIPNDASNLKISISGGTGDANLYVKRNSAPTINMFDCGPQIIGSNNEACFFTAPAGNTYYIMITTSSQYNGVTLSVSYQRNIKPINLTPILNLLLN